MEKAQISQVSPRLTVYGDEFFTGSSIIVRGNLGIRNAGEIESLRFLANTSRASLVLFTRTAFRGNFRIYQGAVRNLPDLEDLLRGADVGSIISSNEHLSVARVRQIRNTGSLPSGFRII